MCKCTPEIKTPYCSKPGCEWPKTVEEQVMISFTKNELQMLCGKLMNMEMDNWKIKKVIEAGEKLFSALRSFK